MQTQPAKWRWRDYQALFETLPDAVVRLGVGGIVRAYNSEAQLLFAQLFSSTQKHILEIGRPLILVARDVRGRPLSDETSPIASILRGESIAGSNAVLIRCSTSDGRDLFLRISGAPLLVEKEAQDTTNTDYVVILRDVTESTQRRRYLDEMVLQGAIEQRRQRVREERTQRISPLMSDYTYTYQILADGSTKRDWITEAFTHITGYKTEELDQAEGGWGKLFHPDDWGSVRAYMDAMRAGVADVREWRIITRKGEVHWLRNWSHPARDEGSGVIYVYGASHDITEQKKVEQQVSNLTQQLSATFEAITDGILIYDREGHLLQTNSVARDLLPVALQSEPIEQQNEREKQSAHLQGWVKGMNVRDEYGQPLALTDLPQYQVLHGEVLQGTRAMDMLVTAADGRNRYLNVSGSPIRDSVGEQIGAVLILRDVTTRRQQEQWMQKALQSLFAMTEAIVQSAEEFDQPDGAADEAAYSARQQVIYHLLSLSRDLLGSKIAGIVAIDERVGQLLPIATSGLASKQREQFEAELTRFRLDNYFQPEESERLVRGEVILLQLAESPMKWLNEFGLYHVLVAPLYIGERSLGIVWLDYSVSEQSYPLHQAMELFKVVGRLAALVIERERLMHERIVAQARALAESETNRQKDEFLSLTSYELRTPLATIKAGLQLTEQQVRELYTRINLASVIEQIEELLARGERQVAVESRLIGDLLDISRNQERLALTMKLCNLLDVIRNVVADVQSSNTTRDIRTSVHTESTQGSNQEGNSPPDMVPIVADIERIGQVLMNYLNNAIKYSPVDEPIDIEVHCDKTIARVCVVDKGQGIRFSEQLKIWERFYQVSDRTIYSGSSGLGLGLALCRSIIEQHGGLVGVESEPGNGATFWFTLPVANESLTERVQ